MSINKCSMQQVYHKNTYIQDGNYPTGLYMVKLAALYNKRI